MIIKKKMMSALTSVSVVLTLLAVPCFANDSSQQIAAISQEIQTLQEQLNAANNKIEKLCDSSIPKNMTNQAAPSQIHRTANGRGR
ncbi:MAG: hypothetical protein RL755_200 [Pseudomonadota bacterium]|jgi:peptidoglycan hydrolase CwlO-like protein